MSLVPDDGRHQLDCPVCASTCTVCTCIHVGGIYGYHDSWRYTLTRCLLCVVKERLSCVANELPNLVYSSCAQVRIQHSLGGKQNNLCTGS
jgi:hypothetical protein